EGGEDLHLLAALEGIPAVEALERDAALDHLRLQHVEGCGRAILAVGGDENLLARPLDLGVGAAEVVALADLLARLVDGVVRFLAVDLTDDVEAAVGHSANLPEGSRDASMSCQPCSRC